MKVEVVEFQVLQCSVDGNNFTPSATEIYKVVFEGCNSLRGHSCSATNFLDTGLQFSRYLADPTVILTTEATGENPSIDCQLFAKYGSKEGQVSCIGNVLMDYAILDGVWIPIPPEIVDEVAEFLGVVGANSFGYLSLAQYMKAVRWIGGSFTVEDRTMAALSASRIAPRLTGTIPMGFIGKLFPYQRDGFRWLSYMVKSGLGGIIADEMGLGKTVQVICILLEASKEDERPNLVIAPNSVLENWRRELSRFAPSLRVAVHSGSRRTGNPLELIQNNVVLCSFDTAVIDATLFRNVAWNLMVVDEAQGIKNYHTRRSIQLKTFPRRCSVAMTGTPIENRLMDLWSITDFVLPGLLGSASDFERKYPDTSDAALSLEPIVSPLILRRTVSEVAGDLPERIDIPQPLILDSESANVYEAIRISAVSQGSGAGLAALQKLRMFCTHPWLADSFQQLQDPTQCSVKLQRVLEILEEVVALGGKAIIFTSYTESIDLIRRVIESKLGIYVDSIDGRVLSGNRQGKVDVFSSVDGPAVLVLNPKAAGVGLNITAANHVIHFNLEWNPAVEDQASARAHRRGQIKVVTVHRLFYSNTVEEVIDDRTSRKRELSSAAIVGTTGESLDMSDIVRALQISPV